MLDMLKSTKDRQPLFTVPSQNRLNQVKLIVSCVLGLYFFWCASDEEPLLMALLVGILSFVTFYFLSDRFVFKKYFRIKSE